MPGTLSTEGSIPSVLSDCVSSPYKDGHDRSLENMKNLITIINSKELENIWSRTKKLSSDSTVYDDGNSMHHEHMGVCKQIRCVPQYSHSR